MRPPRKKKSRGQKRPERPQRTAKEIDEFRNLRKVVGIHACKEVLKVRPKSIVELWLKKDWYRSQDHLEIGEWAKKKSITVKEKTEGQLARVAETHQGVCAMTSETPGWDESLVEKDEPQIYVALDEISDPHNLGAVLRSAWLLSVSALLIPERRAAPLTPSAIKVASGGAEHVPVVSCENLTKQLEHMKTQGFWVLGLSGGSQSKLWNIEIPEKVVWVVGSEDKGLRKSVAKICDQLVSIPQVDSAASFNASVAVALALGESTRQRQTP